MEEDLKAGRLPAVVATSSLELGIDMGAVDLVVQVESPPSRGLRPPACRPGGTPFKVIDPETPGKSTVSAIASRMPLESIVLAFLRLSQTSLAAS